MVSYTKTVILYIEKVKQEFSAIDGASIAYTGQNTKNPDMRIRKKIVKGVRFINAVTIKWQPQKKRFVLATALKHGEVKSCGLSVEIHEKGHTLTSVFYLDETIINKNMPEILKTLKYAHKTREHKGHK